MRRTKEIKLTLLATLAMASTGACRQPRTEVRNCIDAQGHIVVDWDCDQPNNSSSGGYHGGFHYIYGGSSGGRIGDTVFGGSVAPSSGSRIVSGETGGVVRGGFGRGGGHASGGGE